MNNKNLKLNYIYPVFFIFVTLFLFSCENGVKTGSILFTQVLHEDQNVRPDEESRFPEKSQVVALTNNSKKGSLKVLTNDFISACSPQISYNGEKMLFAAKKNEEENWQIWEMDLKNLKSRKIISLPEDCTDPCYLPGDRIFFSKLVRNDTTGNFFALFTCNIDGCCLKQITFHPHANLASVALSDGRILTVSKQLYPDTANSMYYVMRPDGTKADMLYKNSSKKLFNRASESKDGKIYFIESDDHNNGGDIIKINLNRPLYTRESLTSNIEGYFGSVQYLQTGNLLVTYKGENEDFFSLYEFDPIKKILLNQVYKVNGYDITETVLAESYDRPRKLPSEVDEKVLSGQIMCQNINIVNNNKETFKKAAKIEVLGIDTTYGIVDVEEDGSFYLKVLANLPVRIQTLDDAGKVVNGPSSWLWLRPNERRGCVGCHEDYELVPENKVPLAVKKRPVSIPTDVSEENEVKAELE